MARKEDPKTARVAEKVTIAKILGTSDYPAKSSWFKDLDKSATAQAKKYANQLQQPVEFVYKLGDKEVKKTEKPDARPTYNIEKAEKEEKKDPQPDDKRKVNQTQGRTGDSIGRSDEVDDEENVPSGNTLTADTSNLQNGEARSLGGQMPSMESLLNDIPSNLVNKFIGQLPGNLQSLIPNNLITGLTQSGPISLNGLLNTIGGGALGSAASEAIRSTSSGINAVSGLTGALGAIPLSNITNSLGNFGATTPFANIGTQTAGLSPQTSAVLSNVVGSIAQVLVQNGNRGIPVTPQSLGLATNVVLNSIGSRVSIPTQVLGLLNSQALGPIINILQATGSPGTALLPQNLSLANSGVLSGLTQNLAQNLAGNIIPRQVLDTLLPGNLRQLIPSVVPGMSGIGGSGNGGNNPGWGKGNNVGDSRNNSPDQLSQQGGGGKPGQADKAFVDGSGGINYGQVISPGGITLGRVSKHCQFPHDIVPQGGLSTQQIIKNLSFTATNYADKVLKAYPGGNITHGFRTPLTGSKHCKGQAIDIQWKADRNKHIEIANWVSANVPGAIQILWELTPNGAWLVHCACQEGSPGGVRPQFWSKKTGLIANYNPMRQG